MLAVFLAFLRLGCTSFGGPAAHLGYFRREFVQRRRWLSEAQFAQCVALTQVLPGPASSQTGMLVGLLRAGWPGAVAAWLGFTLPSAVLMVLFARYSAPDVAHAGWLRGLLDAAVAVVAQALVMMRRTLIHSAGHVLLAFAAAAIVLAVHSAVAAPAAIALCALSALAMPSALPDAHEPLRLNVSRSGALVALCAFAVLLIALPLLARTLHNDALALAAKMFDTGSLVFGGGHVVLPLLQSQVVSARIASTQSLIAGYAEAQALPGPLFTLSSYIGAIADGGTLGIAGAVIATVAIFLPSFLLIAGIAPFYTGLAQSARFSRALGGANAGVVGLLAAAFVVPIWTNAVHSAADGLLAALAFLALTAWRRPNWAVAGACAAAGFALFR